MSKQPEHQKLLTHTKTLFPSKQICNWYDLQLPDGSTLFVETYVTNSAPTHEPKPVYLAATQTGQSPQVIGHIDTLRDVEGGSW